MGAGVSVGYNAVVLAFDGEGSAPTVLQDGVHIGSNATVLPGVTIGTRAQVEPGSVVGRSVPPRTIVTGNPARIAGYTDAPQNIRPATPTRPTPGEMVLRSRVRGVALYALRRVDDIRGNLSVGEFERDIPFRPRRYFLVFDVPTNEMRGEHAHRRCEQFLVAINGSLSIVVDDGKAREEFLLAGPDHGLYVPPMVWATQYLHSRNPVLLVFASEFYDPDDYIRDYGEFLDA
jgi:Acetyltransferase (isoleucine patch superfamily)